MDVLSLPARKPTAKRVRAAIARAIEEENVRAKLSPALVADLRPPRDRPEAFVWDLETRGFGVRVLKSGRRSWVVQYRVRHQSIRRTIAACDRLPFTLARERAREILALSALDRDWFKERAERIAAEEAEEQTADVPTLGDRLDEYLADPVVRRLRTFTAIERRLTTVLAPIRDKDPETISSRDIRQALETIAANSGIVSANRARSSLLTAFRWLLDSSRLQRDDNPVARSRPWKERGRRHRAPSLEELGRVYRACDEIYPQSFGCVVKLLVLTAARKSEIANLTRNEVNLERAEIMLPPQRVKIDMPFVIPLSKPAVRLLRALPERRGTQRVFPIIAWSRCKKLLDKKAGVDGWVLHDLRRSFSSLARDELNAEPEVVERSLGHVPLGIRGKYDFSERQQQRRQLAEEWARLILRAAGEPVEQQPALRVVGSR